MDIGHGAAVQHCHLSEKLQLMRLQQIWELRLQSPTELEGGVLPASPAVKDVTFLDSAPATLAMTYLAVLVARCLLVGLPQQQPWTGQHSVLQMW